MRDPYLYEDVLVLRNLLGIKTQELLDEAEAAFWRGQGIKLIRRLLLYCNFAARILQ